MTRTRKQLIAICIDGFFEMLNAHDLDGVMLGISEDCEMRIPSSNSTYTGKPALRDHLDDFIQSFPTIHFRDFIAAVDSTENRVAVRFNISLVDDEGETTHMSNCNFFEIGDDGRLEDILIFASAPLSKGFEVGNNR